MQGHIAPALRFSADPERSEAENIKANGQLLSGYAKAADEAAGKGQAYITVNGQRILVQDVRKACRAFVDRYKVTATIAANMDTEEIQGKVQEARDGREAERVRKINSPDKIGAAINATKPRTDLVRRGGTHAQIR